MNRQHYKFGENGWEPVSFASVPDRKFWQAVEKFSQKWLKVILAAGVVALLWAWSTAVAAPSYSMDEMRDYAVEYLNQVK